MISRLVFLLVAFAALSSHASEMGSLKSQQVSEIGAAFPQFYYVPLAGANDFAVFFDQITSSVLVMKKDPATGTYLQVGTKATTSVALSVSTDGEWFLAITSSGSELFRLAADGTAVDEVIIPLPVGRIMPDGSYMGSDGLIIYTYEYISNEWTNTVNSTFPGPLGFTIIADSITNTNMVVPDTSATDLTVFLIEYQQTNKTWVLADTVPLNSSYNGGLNSYYWDGADTLFVGLLSVTMPGTALPLGAVVIFTKTNGIWEETQRFYAVDAGISGYGYFTLSPFISIDENNLAVASILDNFGGAVVQDLGSIILFSKMSGEWKPAVKITPDTEPHGIFGAGLAKNGEDILTFDCVMNSTFICYLQAFPSCVVAPIDMTCNSGQLDACPTTVDPDNLFTINNPKCGSVTYVVDDFSADQNGVHVDMVFSRQLAQDVVCNITLTCPPVPQAPVAVPQAKTAGASYMIAHLLLWVTLLLVVF